MLLLCISCATPLKFPQIDSNMAGMGRVRIEVRSYPINGYKFKIRESGIYQLNGKKLELKSKFDKKKYPDLHVYIYHIQKRTLLIFDFSSENSMLMVIGDPTKRAVQFVSNYKRTDYPISDDIPIGASFFVDFNYKSGFTKELLRKYLDYELVITPHARYIMRQMSVKQTGNKILSLYGSQVLNYGYYKKVRIFTKNNCVYYEGTKRNTDKVYRTITQRGLSKTEVIMP